MDIDKMTATMPTKIELQLIDDLEKFATFKVVTKLDYYIKAGKIKSPDDVYQACNVWSCWRNNKLDYNPAIYGNISIYNECGISTKQLKAVFGKTIGPNGKRTYRRYSHLLQFSKLSIGKHGKAFCAGKGKEKEKADYFCHTFLPPKELIDRIFADDELLEKVKDYNSDYYTPRQRKLIKNAAILDKSGKSVIRQMREKNEPKKAANVPDEDISNTTQLQEDKDMTKTEKENLRIECENGQHGLPYEVLIKDIERKERREKLTQQKRIEKIVDRKIALSKYDETEYIYMQEQLDAA